MLLHYLNQIVKEQMGSRSPREPHYPSPLSRPASLPDPGSEESYTIATLQNLSSALACDLCRAFYFTTSCNLVKRVAGLRRTEFIPFARNRQRNKIRPTKDAESLGLYPSAKTCQRVDISPPKYFLAAGNSTRQKRCFPVTKSIICDDSQATRGPTGKI